MKKIEAIIRSAKLGDVCAALDEVGHPGIMITEVEGHGKQKGVEQQFRGKTFKVEFMTKAMVQVIVNDADVDKTVKAIRESLEGGGILAIPVVRAKQRLLQRLPCRSIPVDIRGIQPARVGIRLAIDVHALAQDIDRSLPGMCREPAVQEE